MVAAKTAQGLHWNESQSKVFTVTYTGGPGGKVGIWAHNAGINPNVLQFTTIKIERGTGNFTPEATLYTGPMDTWVNGTANNAWNALDTGWSPNGPATKTFRITVTFNRTAPGGWWPTNTPEPVTYHWVNNNDPGRAEIATGTDSYALIAP
jgi:hypothetical protein